MKKKALSLLLALTMCLSLLPTAALAEERQGTAPPASEGQDEQGGAPAPGDTDEAVESVQAQIDALPGVDELDGMAADALDAAYMAVQDAYDAYEALTADQQAEIAGADRFEALLGWFNEQVAPLAESEYISPDDVDADGNIIRRDGWSRKGLICEGSEGSATFTGNQFYVVQGNDVTIGGNLTIGGSCGLILCQGATLTVEGALICSGSYSIYGQSNGGANAGRLVIKNSLNEDGGAAIRPAADATGTPTLHIDSGELVINGGSSKTLIDGVKLASEKTIHKGTLDGTAVSPEVWGADSLKGGTLTLAYCQHEHSADQELIPDSGGAAHHRHCMACGFDWASEACDFDNPDHYVPNPKDKANTHFSVCECGNVSTTPAEHDPTAIPTDDGQGHTQRCMYCLYTSTENNPVEEHHYKADGECENCGFKPAARDAAGNLYESAGDALKATEDGSWVMLETHAEDGGKELRKEIEFNYPGKTVELKMNGYTLTNSGNPTLTVENGTLKITGDATINQTGTFSDLAAPAVKVTGGKLIFDGKLTATGASGKYAVEVNGGELKLKVGDVLNGGVSVASGTVADLLGENLAFAKKDDASTIVKGDGTSISEDVTVVAHTHSFTLGSDGKYTCVCGYTCPHNDFKDGKCTICHNGCAHTNVGDDGVCRDCKTQMVAKIEAGGTTTYTTDLTKALNSAADGTKITLLTDVGVGNVVLKDKTVTLDLNGKSIGRSGSGSAPIQIGSSSSHASLIITGSGNIGNIFQYLIVKNGTLDLSGWTGDHIYQVTLNGADSHFINPTGAGKIYGLAFIKGAATASLNGGRYDEIAYEGDNGIELGDLLAEGYAFRQEDGTFLECAKKLENKDTVKNVEVVRCPHSKIGTNGTCAYCGKTGIQATVGSKIYEDVDTAVTEWLSGTAAGTLTLYSNYSNSRVDFSSASGKTLVLDLNGFAFNKDIAMTLGGAGLTIRDSREKTSSQGAFGPITADNGALTLESGGYLQGLTIPKESTATVLLRDGKVSGLDCPKPVYTLLPDGYALMNGNITVDPTSILSVGTATYTIKNAKTQLISKEESGSTTFNSGTIPFALSLKTDDSEIGKMSFEWYRIDSDGKAVKLAGSNEDMTPDENGVYTFDAAYAKMGFDGWNSMTPGTYDVMCVVIGKESNGAYCWQTPMRGYELTVTPASIENAEVTVDDSGLTYNGRQQSPTVTVKLGDKTLEQNKDYTISGNTGTNAGKYTTLTITGKGNYTGKKERIGWEIKPAPLTITVAGTVSKPYDGTDTADADVTFSGLQNGETLTKGTDYTVTAKYDSASVGGGKSVTGTVTLSGTIKRYVLSGSAISATGTITKAAAPTSTEGKLTVTNRRAHTYEVDLAALLPELASPCAYGEITYSELGVVMDSSNISGYYTGGAKIEGGRLTLPIQAVETDKTGTIGEVRVKVTTDNYQDFTLTIHVDAANKIVPTGAPTLSRNTLVWGEKLSSIALSGTMMDGEDKVEGTFTWDAPDAVPDRMDPYRAAWTFTPKDTARYTETTGSVEIAMEKAAPAGAPGYTKIAASGKTLKDAALTVGTIQPAGTIRWDLAETTTVAANTAYR